MMDLYIMYLVVMISLSLFILIAVLPSYDKKAVFIEKDLKDGIWYPKHEVRIVGESNDCYKIKRWWFSVPRWIPKKAISVRLDFVK